MRRGIAALLLALIVVCLAAPVLAAEEQTAEPVPASADAAAGFADAEPLQSASLPPEEGVAEPSPSADAEETPSPELTPTADESQIPQQAFIQARIAGEGNVEFSEEDGNAIELGTDGVFAVEQGSIVKVEAVPESGSEYVRAAYNGRKMDTDIAAGAGRKLSFTATESGELEVVFAPRSERDLEVVISGSAAVSMAGPDGQRSLASGQKTTVPDGAAVSFRVVPQNGSDFDGADFNGRAIAATKDGAGWVFDLPVKEDGVLTIRTTSTCTVSTILDHTELLYENNGSWQQVKEGDSVLAIPAGQSASFVVRPKSGWELITLLVNGADAGAQQRSDGHYFRVDSIQGPLIITAVAGRLTDTIQGVDPKTGVRYRLPGTADDGGSNITGDSWISVVELTSGAAYEQAVVDSLPYGRLLSAYDLTLHNADGTYEPSVPVTVSFPIPDALRGGNLKVLHASGKSVSEIPYRTEDIQGVPCATVMADAFSLYMLVAAPDDAAAAPGEVSNSGDSNTTSLVLLLMILGLGGLAILLFRRRRPAH